MIIVSDNITATLIGGAVAVILMSLQWQVQESATEHLLLYSTKKQTMELADMLERDLEEAGYGLDMGGAAIIQHHDSTMSGVTVTDLFEFIGIGASGTQANIRYITTRVDSVEEDGGWAPLFEMIRYEQQPDESWQAIGGSSSMLTAFDIDTLDENSNGATGTSIRRIRVRFEQALPVIGSSEKYYLRRLYWGITLNPQYLILQGYEG